MQHSPRKVKASSGVTSGLLIKKVNPTYAADARAAYIQGTVLLQAEISKTGDITGLGWSTAQSNWRVLRWPPCVNGSTSLTC